MDDRVSNASSSNPPYRMRMDVEECRVYVTPNAKQPRVVKVSEDYLEIWVDERAVAGRADKRLLEILAEHFKTPKSKITILKGTKQDTNQSN